MSTPRLEVSFGPIWGTFEFHLFLSCLRFGASDFGQEGCPFWVLKLDRKWS